MILPLNCKNQFCEMNHLLIDIENTFKDILPWHISQMITKTVPISTRINFPFHRITYDYSCAYWDSLCGHLRDPPWENAFKLIASAAASEFL